MKLLKRIMAMILVVLLLGGNLVTPVLAAEGDDAAQEKTEQVNEAPKQESAPAQKASTPKKTAAPKQESAPKAEEKAEEPAEKAEAPKQEAKPAAQPEPKPAETKTEVKEEVKTEVKEEVKGESEAKAPEAENEYADDVNNNASTPEAKEEAPAAPAEEKTEAPAEGEAQAPAEGEAEGKAPAEGKDKAPATYTVTFKYIVDGAAVAPDVKDDYAAGAKLAEPEESKPYEQGGCDIKYFKDEQKTQEIDFDKDVINVSADMTIWVVVSHPEKDEPAADEPSVGEPAVDEPVADEPAADEPAAEVTVKFVVFPVKGTDGEGWILEQTYAPGEAVALPKAADIPGFPGELLLGGWYLDEAMTQSTLDYPAVASKGAVFYAIAVNPKTEYAAAPLAQSGNLEVTLKIQGGKKDHYEVGDTITFVITVTNHRDISSMQEIGVTYSGLSGITNVRFDDVGRRLNWETKSNGWHFQHNGWDSFGVLSGLHVNESTTITFDYVIKESDVDKNLSLTVGAQNGWGVTAETTESINDIQVKKTDLKVEVKGSDISSIYNGAEQVAKDYTVTVTNKKTGAVVSSDAVKVTVGGGYEAKGTDVGEPYPMSLVGNVTVAVNNNNIYKLDNSDINVINGSLTITKKHIDINVKADGELFVNALGTGIGVSLDGQPAGLVQGHTLTLTDAKGNVDTSSAGQKDIKDVSGNVKIFSGANDVTKNYDWSFAGTAEVKALHVITVSVVGGTAEPKGAVSVEHGKDATITFKPQEHYILDSAKMDGRDVDLTKKADGTYSYTFSNVDSDHTINVVFALDENGDGTPDYKETHTVKYIVTDAPDDADPAPTGETVNYGDSYTVDTAYGKDPIVVTRDKNGNPLDVYTFDGWYLDGVKVTDPTIVVKEDVTLTGSWAIDEEKSHTNDDYLHDVTVNYVADNGSTLTKPSIISNVTKGDTYDVSSSIYETLDVGGVNYMKTKVEGAISGEMDDKDVDITVTYTRDANMDGKADKDQTLAVKVIGETYKEPYDGAGHSVGYRVEVTVGGEKPETYAPDKVPEWLGLTVENGSLSSTNVIDQDMTMKASITATGWAEEVEPEVEQGRLTITQRKVTVTADNVSIKFGEEPKLTATVDGVVEGEEGVIEYKITCEKPYISGEDIIVSGEENQGNYRVKFVNGKLTVNAPDAPTMEEVSSLLTLYFDCYSQTSPTGYEVLHEHKEYPAAEGLVTIGAPYMNGDRYQVDVTIDWDAVCEKYSEDVRQKHTLRGFTAEKNVFSMVYCDADQKEAAGAAYMGWNFLNDDGSIPQSLVHVSTGLNGSCTYTVTYDDACGVSFGQQNYYPFLDGDVPAFNSGADKADMDKNGNPVREGYVFDGWWKSVDTELQKIFVANWADDVNGDGIKDKDQTVDVLVTGKKVELPYNGQTQTLNGYEGYDYTVKIGEQSLTAEQAESLYGISVNYTDNAKARGKDVKTYTAELYDWQFNVNNYWTHFKDAKVTVVVPTIELTITPLAVSLESKTVTKVYDGEPLVNGDAEVLVKGDGFVPGEGVKSYEFTGSRTNVGGKGKNENAFNYTLKDNTKAENYKIDTTFGDLIVTKADASKFTPTLSQEDWMYGEKQPAPQVTVDGPGADGYDEPVLTYTYYGPEGPESVDKPVHAGDYSVTAVWQENNNLPELRADAEFQVTYRPIRIHTPFGAKVYDGTPLSLPEAEVIPGTFQGVQCYDLAKGDTFTFDPNSFPSKTNVYEDGVGVWGYMNECDWEITSADGSVLASSDDPSSARDYVLYMDIGSINVYARYVALFSMNREKVYDGTPLTDSVYSGQSVAQLAAAGVINTEYDYNALYDRYNEYATAPNKGQGGLVGGDADKVTIDFTGSRTDVNRDRQTNTFIVNWNGVDSRNYAIARGIGYLVIDPRPVTLQSGTYSWKYDGQYHSEPTVTTIEGTSMAPGEEFTFSGFPTVRDVGEPVENTYTVADGSAKQSNYDITVRYGTVAVRPAIIPGEDPVLPGEEDDVVDAEVSVLEDRVYNGQPQAQAPSVVLPDGTELIPGTDYTVRYTEDVTNAGRVDVTVEGTGNYKGAVTRSYNITPAPLTVTTGSATKTFDGAALRSGTARIGGLVNGETATIRATGSRTAVGTSRNGYAITWDGSALESNYEIVRENLGTLTVNPAPVVPGPVDPGPDGPDAPDDGPDGPDDPGDDPAGPDEPVEINEDEAPLAGLPTGNDVVLSEEETIDEDAAPLAAGPVEHVCCILHFILMLCAFAVSLWYTHDRKKRQEREYELRDELC